MMLYDFLLYFLCNKYYQKRRNVFPMVINWIPMCSIRERKFFFQVITRLITTSCSRIISSKTRKHVDISSARYSSFVNKNFFLSNFLVTRLVVFPNLNYLSVIFLHQNKIGKRHGSNAVVRNSYSKKWMFAFLSYSEGPFLQFAIESANSVNILQITLNAGDVHSTIIPNNTKQLRVCIEQSFSIIHLLLLMNMRYSSFFLTNM